MPSARSTDFEGLQQIRFGDRLLGAEGDGGLDLVADGIVHLHDVAEHRLGGLGNRRADQIEGDPAAVGHRLGTMGSRFVIQRRPDELAGSLVNPRPGGCGVGSAGQRHAAPRRCGWSIDIGIADG